ncbi:MAG TPA: hypothetical protein VFI02_02010, partial [Armatimonadota bacterium]|nr:hypothetical protein [Armatimonadota bacterium]
MTTYSGVKSGAAISCGSEEAVAGIVGNITTNIYYAGTCRIKETRQRAGWAGADTTVAKFEYSADGKLLKTTDAMGNVTTNEYTPAGFLLKVTDPRGDYTENDYDLQGRQLESRRYGLGGVGPVLMGKTKSVYDELGRVVEARVCNPRLQGQEQESNEILTKNTYHMNGGLYQVEYPDSTTEEPIKTTYEYNAVLRKFSQEQDAEGNITNYVYDPAGRTVAVERIAGGRTEVTTTAYCQDGRVKLTATWGTGLYESALVTTYEYNYDDSEDAAYTLVTDPELKTFHTYVDLLGRTTKIVADKGEGHINQTTLYTYDEVVAGGCRNTIVAKNEPHPDQITEYLRTDQVDAGLVTSVVYPDGKAVVSTYNPDGTLRTKTDQRGWTTTFTRDGLRRVTQEDVSTVQGKPVEGTVQVIYR